MNILAIVTIPSDKTKAVDVLARVMGASKYDAQARLRFSGNGPLIIKSYAQTGDIEHAAVMLGSAGFRTVALMEGETGAESSRFPVRNFSMDGQRLHVMSRQDERIMIDYEKVSLLLRGTSIARTSETEVVKNRKFNLGRAVLSSGLVVTKTTTKTSENVTEQREGFLHLYGGADRVIVFRETALDYASLGPQLKPAGSANFAFLVAELRKRCPGAVYNETLLNRGGQVQLLGPLFNPEDHLDIAISVMAKSFLYRAK